MKYNKPLNRKTEKRGLKKKFIIYTEGKNTEPAYFQALWKKYPGFLLEFSNDIISAAGVPLTIAMKASERSKSIDKYDEIWAVFDRDEHPNVEEAINICRQAEVGIAFSDPCFELWLILHCQDFDKADNHQKVQKHLEKIRPEYKRSGSKKCDFDSLLDQLNVAQERAEAQYKRRCEEGIKPLAPYTFVYKLTKKIVEADIIYNPGN